jgi:hypothetical protein
MRTCLVVALALTTGFTACGGDSSSSADGPRGTGGDAAAGGVGGGGAGGGGSGGTGGSGGGGAGGMASLGCGVGAGSSSCNKAELDTYNNCTYAACETQFKACFGAGVAMGTFGGACGTFIQCTSKCGCSDLTCFLGCGTPSAECLTCSEAVQTCQDSSSCTKPACLQQPDGGTPNPIFDGGLPSFDGLPSFPDGLFGGTCADLTTCCAAIADAPKKAQCQATLGIAGGNDTICGAAYSAFKASGDCP